jgi:hypothetical protein
MPKDSVAAQIDEPEAESEFVVVYDLLRGGWLGLRVLAPDDSRERSSLFLP